MLDTRVVSLTKWRAARSKNGKRSLRMKAGALSGPSAAYLMLSVEKK